MTDPYAHLTPKPLHEQVPGAWNFVEPNPRLTYTGGDAGQITIAPPMEMRIKLSEPARRRLLEALKEGHHRYAAGELETVYGEGAEEDPNDPDWRRVEEALTEIMLPPQRWATGLPQPRVRAQNVSEYPG